MAEQGGLISPEDFTSLKNLINTEITRRSNANSSGSISTYKGTSWQFSETPANGKFITYEHIQKITTPLNAIDGNTPTPDKESLVYAQTLKDCLVKINDLSSKSLTGSSSGCRSSCTGLCSSACYSGCTGCSGDCSGTCKSGCSGCSGDCDGCSGTCENQCQGSCKNGCQSSCHGCTGCEGWCTGNGCGTHCSGNCGVGLNN